MFTYIKTQDSKGKHYLLGPYLSEFDHRAQQKKEALESSGNYCEFVEYKTRDLARATKQMKESRLGRSENLDSIVRRVGHTTPKTKSWEGNVSRELESDIPASFR